MIVAGSGTWPGTVEGTLWSYEVRLTDADSEYASVHFECIVVGEHSKAKVGDTMLLMAMTEELREKGMLK